MKGKRQEKILEIIKDQIIFTQEDLQNALNRLGFKATQSTVSRDIKELRLHKSHDEFGNYRYQSPVQKETGMGDMSRFRELFSGNVISIDYAMNDIVIKCYNGMAQSVCVAIDALYENTMLGSVAGDDTILIIVRSEEEARLFAAELNKML